MMQLTWRIRTGAPAATGGGGGGGGGGAPPWPLAPFMPLPLPPLFELIGAAAAADSRAAAATASGGGGGGGGGSGKALESADCWLDGVWPGSNSSDSRPLQAKPVVRKSNKLCASQTRCEQVCEQVCEQAESCAPAA